MFHFIIVQNDKNSFSSYEPNFFVKISRLSTHWSICCSWNVFLIVCVVSCIVILWKKIHHIVGTIPLTYLLYYYMYLLLRSWQPCTGSHCCCLLHEQTSRHPCPKNPYVQLFLVFTPWPNASCNINWNKMHYYMSMCICV